MSVTATDQNAATGPATTKAVEVVPVAVQGMNLVVGGTTGDDQITITQVSGLGATVEVNGQNLGTFYFGTPTPAPPAGGGVIVYAQDGNDTVTLVGMDFGRLGRVHPRRHALRRGRERRAGRDRLHGPWRSCSAGPGPTTCAAGPAATS